MGKSRRNRKKGIVPSFHPKTGYGPSPVVERPEMLNKPSKAMVKYWENKLQER